MVAVHQVFCEKDFLSEENTLKVIAPKTLAAREERSHHIRAADALEPLDLCRACTLRPPCQHISEQVRGWVGGWVESSHLCYLPREFLAAQLVDSRLFTYFVPNNCAVAFFEVD